MDDLIPSECCDHKYYSTSQKLFENWCVFLKLSVVFQHPHCALSSLNACAEAQINLPVSSYRMLLLISSCSLIIAVPGSLKAVYKGDKASSYVVAAISLNDFSHTPIIFSTRLCLCFVRMSACSKRTHELSALNP